MFTAYKKAALRFCVYAAIILCLFSNSSFAQNTDVPRVISYQGQITLSNGSQISGIHKITATLYADRFGKTSVWIGEYNAEIIKGIFNIPLGSGKSKLPENSIMDQPLWIGIKVDEDEQMKPLTQLTSVPYALNIPDKSITSAKLADEVLLSMKSIKTPTVQWVGDPGGGTNLANTTDAVAGGIGNDARDWHDSHGGADTGQHNFIGGGEGNMCDDFSIDHSIVHHSVIGGGMRNKNLSICNFIGGGRDNTLGDSLTALGGGEDNNVYDSYSGIFGGKSNTVSPRFSFIGGGKSNDIRTNEYSSIVGGEINKIGYGEDIFPHCFIGGGLNNWVRASSSSIVGGDSNLIMAPYSIIGGGQINKIYAGHSFIGGGNSNIDSSTHSVIGGGEYNIISQNSDHSLIGGGYLNNIYRNGYDCVIAGGHSNSIGNAAHLTFSAIGGGASNRISSDLCTIPGGYNLSATSWNETVLGCYNTIRGTSGWVGVSLVVVPNDPKFVIGNGFFDPNPFSPTFGINLSNAFEVSNNGHSIVYDINGTGAIIGGRASIKGGTYTDNVIYAWGKIEPYSLTTMTYPGDPAPGGKTPALQIYSPVADFGVGVLQMRHISKFAYEYVITLNVTDVNGNPLKLDDSCSITATPWYPVSDSSFSDIISDWAGYHPPSTRSIMVSNMKNNRFKVWLYDVCTYEPECEPKAFPFYFKVTGRPILLH